MSSTTLVKNMERKPIPEMTNYQLQLLEKHKDVSLKPLHIRSDAQALMAFNGYYTLDTAAGAFFAVDTNILFLDGLPIYDISLFISLDGTSSYQYSFAGSFDGNRLVQPATSSNNVTIELAFTRTDGSEGYTATCTGSIAIQGGAASSVSGYTYNNPIPPSLYAGTYYEAPQAEALQGDSAPGEAMQSQSPGEALESPVMTIGDRFQLSYDNGSGLQEVRFYAYNMNMYYFTFWQGSDTISLIMGTAGAKGFACNNMIVDGATITTKALYTIPGSDVPSSDAYYDDLSTLAGFSGYYPLPSIAPLAFLSVQASYITEGSAEKYQVAISLSMDGTSSEGYYFDPQTMGFANNTLTMTAQHIRISFNREYNAAQGSLVTATGTVNGHSIIAYNLLNPVPLAAFRGVPMTDSQGDKLTVVSDTEVIYNGTTMTGIIYVPLMYILAWPASAPTIEMSFGTSKLDGNTCIVTDGSSGQPTTAVVSAIPGT